MYSIFWIISPYCLWLFFVVLLFNTFRTADRILFSFEIRFNIAQCLRAPRSSFLEIERVSDWILRFVAFMRTWQLPMYYSLLFNNTKLKLYPSVSNKIIRNNTSFPGLEHPPHRAAKLLKGSMRLWRGHEVAKPFASCMQLFLLVSRLRYLLRNVRIYYRFKMFIHT